MNNFDHSSIIKIRTSGKVSLISVIERRRFKLRCPGYVSTVLVSVAPYWPHSIKDFDVARKRLGAFHAQVVEWRLRIHPNKMVTNSQIQTRYVTRARGPTRDFEFSPVFSRIWWLRSINQSFHIISPISKFQNRNKITTYRPNKIDLSDVCLFDWINRILYI